MTLLAIGLALANDATVTIEGTLVRGSAHLEVPPQRFIAQLGDPGWESTVSGTATRVEVKGRAGDCQLLALVSPNAVMDATYEVRRCPTADGWQSTLITSNVFSTYRSSWKAVPEGDGSRVTYEVDLTTSLWVPGSLVRSEIRRSVLQMMHRVVDWAVRVH